MVTWAADGTMAGYDPVTKKLKLDLFHFASPGTVDLNGFTRLNYPMGLGISRAANQFPNELNPSARITYSAGDYSLNGATSPSVSTKKLSVGMMLVRASNFPEGHVPTPKELFNAPFDWAQRAGTWSWGNGAGTTFTYTFDMGGHENSGYFWDTKWWVLLYPSLVTNINATWSRTNDAPIKGADINVVGRALSFWSNHSPVKPIISSPASGTIHLPGTEFTLSLDTQDPDEMLPTDSSQYNADVAGVQFQYRPQPSVSDPDPAWSDIYFDYTAGTFTTRDGMWHIRGSRYWNGLAGDPYHTALVDNLGCVVQAGAPDTRPTYQPGKGSLPMGDWQIRGRMFDYGHPYPGPGNVTHQPGPLGISPPTQYLIEPAKDTYPAQNTSPWSDPIRITIPTQVPPPLPITPANDLAVSGNAESVRLTWNYRNSHQPPRTQYRRTVQIREVGSLSWSTVFDGITSDAFVDLPYVMTQVQPPPVIVNPDPDFEAGTQPWARASGVSPSVYANDNDSTKAHAGNRYLKATNPTTTRPNAFTDDFGIIQNPVPVTPPAGYLDYEVDGWLWVDASVTPVLVTMGVEWLDADGATITGPLELTYLDTPYVVFFVSKWFSGPAQWYRISDLIPDLDGTDYPFGLYGADAGRTTLTRPPNGVTLIAAVSATTDYGSSTMMANARFDDIFITALPPSLDSFTMEVGHHYEWRVQVTDMDGIVSSYSSPARFWVVPDIGSGGERPVPSSTLDGAELGYGRHRVEIYKRGGLVRVGELTQVSHVDYGRVRDDVSNAQVTVSGWSLDCGNLLAQLQTWAYEVVIFRDNGYSVDRVWEGPITLLTYETDKVTIQARDVVGYLQRRIIRQAMNDVGAGHGTTVVDRARRVIQNCFAPDDPNVLAYLQVIANTNDAMQYRSIPAYSRTGFEEVDDMAANAGLDYTVMGRSILLWGTKNRIGLLPEFRDENLGASPIVSEYGMNFADRYAVSDGNGVFGVAERTAAEPTYGLVEILSSTWASNSQNDTGTFTQAGLATLVESFNDYAEKAISDRNPPPVVVRIPDNTTLNPNTVISIQHLVPGVSIPLRSSGTLRTVVGMQKLDTVKVVEENGKETISITLSPFSQDDAGGGTTDGGGP